MTVCVCRAYRSKLQATSTDLFFSELETSKGGSDIIDCLRKGLWRGVGEPPLRGLYNVLASSSIGHHQFREEASTRSARIFGPAVSTSELPNEAVVSFSPQLRRVVGQISNNSQSAPRSGNAATLPTLQIESRHAASATPPAFRRRKHDHERQLARPCISRLDWSCSMTRDFRWTLSTIAHLPAAACTISAPGSESPPGRGGGAEHRVGRVL